MNQPNQTNLNDTHTTNWQQQANCKNKTNQMFPKDHKDITYIKTARQICKACTVKTPCLEEALQYPTTDMSGVWAGLTPRQLAAEQRRRGISPSKPSIAVIWKSLCGGG
jgi:hypothetical protein